MLEQGQCSADDVLQRIERHEIVWIRLGAVRSGGSWSQSIMEVVSGAAPPRWRHQRWGYEDVVFAAVERTGTEAADWLRAALAEIDGLEVTLPPVGDQVQWERRASQSVHSFEVLQWPHVVYNVAPQSLDKGPGFGSLIAPMFLSLRALRQRSRRVLWRSPRSRRVIRPHPSGVPGAGPVGKDRGGPVRHG